ncbi:hypothetical protein [Streptomyces sp. S1]|uniref:hypothetical protein n=1 Tax=Streptomyces sp. S1 TaxID=718288 RepID=UPI003D73C94F
MPTARPLPADDRDLESFATVLAEELPDNWTVEYHRHEHAEDQLRNAEDVWDLDKVAAAIAESPLGADAYLIGENGTRLYVVLHPRHEEEALVAAMAPVDAVPEAFSGVREPDGIAVPLDPEQAAHAVAADLLPRYDIALAQVRHNAMNPPQPVPGARLEQVVMTWRKDGSLAAVTTARPAAEVLLAEGFAWEAAASAYVLGGDDTRAQAHAVQATGARLARLGISTALRTAHRPTTDLALPAPPSGTHASTRTR